MGFAELSRFEPYRVQRLRAGQARARAGQVSKPRQGMRTLGKTERQTAPSWFRMVVSLLHGRLLLHSSPLVRPMRRDDTRKMNEDADHRRLWEDFHLLHASSLLFALVRRCMDT